MSDFRLFLYGACLSNDEVESKFKSFGLVSKVYCTRDLSYLTLHCSEEQLKKCLSCLNNSTWKQKRIKLCLAKPDSRPSGHSEPNSVATPLSISNGRVFEPIAHLQSTAFVKKRRRMEYAIHGETTNWKDVNGLRVPIIRNLPTPYGHTTFDAVLNSRKLNLDPVQTPSSMLTWSMEDQEFRLFPASNEVKKSTFFFDFNIREKVPLFHFTLDDVARESRNRRRNCKRN